MKRMLLAFLCAAPLVSGYTPEVEPVQTVPPPAEAAYLTSMGCDIQNCTDPAHYHSCPVDCADPTHWHTCPVGCEDPTHPHCNQCWEFGYEAEPEPELRFSMGCGAADCTDVTHYHYCPADCADPAHYHDCPLGCTEFTHPHCGQYWENMDEETASAFCSSMGCGWADCTDPTHYHHCAQGCTDPSHYHDCPLGCRSHDHGYCGRGHHGGRGSRYGRRHH